MAEKLEAFTGNPRPTWEKRMEAATETDWAYAAGYFDGEGWIGIRYQKPRGTKSPNGSWTVRVQINSVDAAPLEWLEETFGGGIVVARKAGPHNKLLWGWCLSSSAVKRWLMGVMPYLKIKDDEARLTLRFWEGPEWTGKLLPPEEHQRRALLAAEVKAIKYKAEYDAESG